MAKIHVRWVRSSTNRKFDQKRTIRALGFRRLGQTVVHSDTPSVRGMITKVQHLVAVEKAEE